MDLRLLTEPQQGATYADVLRVAIEAERLGFDAFFRSDHFLATPGISTESATGLPGPTDVWITLAGLARETQHIRLGTMMTASTFRYPGPLAIAVAQVDQMSGGRIEFGIGAAWFAAEHAAYGIPFPSDGERLSRLEEQIQIIYGMWDTPIGETFSFKGSYFELTDSPALPKPTQQPHPPLLIGGKGKVRTPALAARFADEFNLAAAIPVDEVKAQFERVTNACEKTERDPGSIVLSATQMLCVGENEAEIVRRAERIGRDPAALRANGIGGTVDEVIEKLEAFRGIGARRMYLQILDLTDFDHLRLVAERIMPAVR